MDTEKATFRLHAMAMEGARISWEIPHAHEQAALRRVPRFEAERVVRGGIVVKVEYEPSGQVRWRVSGRDTDERPIHVVVKPIGDGVLRVVTVIRTDE